MNVIEAIRAHTENMATMQPDSIHVKDKRFLLAELDSRGKKIAELEEYKLLDAAEKHIMRTLLQEGAEIVKTHAMEFEEISGGKDIAICQECGSPTSEHEDGCEVDEWLNKVVRDE